MASETKCALQELKKIAAHAQSCPCNNLSLNNSLTDSSKVVSCRNASRTVKKIVSLWVLLFKVFTKPVGSKGSRGTFSSKRYRLLRFATL
ncbi:hypothetical protein PR048_006285 [Dryococelus australis]|uniref:Uncharacterized protein n=1 Tax=Dryococelus australis TaxID=614101 RepID=A0ABQ9IAI3_9NEOP|nr:hypothetical protein PR048_006285 [Dryococelus australis]